MKATYEFFKSKHVTSEALLAPHRDASLNRGLECEVVLAVQDTSNFAFPSSSADDIGYLDHGKGKGLMCHPVFLCSGHGVPLGTIYVDSWARSEANRGKTKNRRKLPIEQKESFKWIKAFRAGEKLLKDHSCVVHIGDREADIYELFCETRNPNSHLLIRATHNRKLVGEQKVWDRIESADVVGKMKVSVREKGNTYKTRKAKVTLRTAKVQLCPPHERKGKKVEIQLVLVEEEKPPKGEDPLKWLLYTTLPVDSVDQIRTCCRYYSHRWRIEQLFYVCKTGCGLEKLQLRKKDRLEKAAITILVVAWRLLWMTYLARVCPDAPSSLALTESEWKILYLSEFKSKQKVDKPPTMQQAVLWMAKLGGFLNRKTDGEPGVKSMWRGMRRLSERVETYELLKSL